MSVPSGSRQPHAALDVEGRREKAERIDARLPWTDLPAQIDLLEVGTGSGVIAHHFARHPNRDVRVSAVDVVDQRQLSQGYDFYLVPDTKLPFDSGIFDVVVTNHVIEHVGDEDDQLSHLSELGRVLRSGGVGYLATPNRWALIEPHFRVAGLSWLPEALRTPYLRLLRKAEAYDCNPLSRGRLKSLIDRAGLGYQFLDVRAVRETADGGAAKLAASLIPDRGLSLLGPVLPTHVCILTKG